MYPTRRLRSTLALAIASLAAGCHGPMMRSGSEMHRVPSVASVALRSQSILDSARISVSTNPASDGQSVEIRVSVRKLSSDSIARDVAATLAVFRAVPEPAAHEGHRVPTGESRTVRGVPQDDGTLVFTLGAAEASAARWQLLVSGIGGVLYQPPVPVAEYEPPPAAAGLADGGHSARKAGWMLVSAMTIMMLARWMW